MYLPEGEERKGEGWPEVGATVARICCLVVLWMVPEGMVAWMEGRMKRMRKMKDE